VSNEGATTIKKKIMKAISLAERKYLQLLKKKQIIKNYYFSEKSLYERKICILKKDLANTKKYFIYFYNKTF